MGNYKFSATTASFYPTALLDMYEQAGTLPADLVDVTDAIYAEFTGQPPEGKMRGSKGKKPVWVDIPPPTPDELRQEATARKVRLQDEAEAAIRRLERAVRLDMATNAEETSLEAWERYSVLLSRINSEDAPDIAWPDVPA